jgi:hypothetical protein
VAVSAILYRAAAQIALNQAENHPLRAIVLWHAACETTMYDAAHAEGAAVRQAGHV